MNAGKIICIGILFLVTAFRIAAQETGRYYYYYMGEKRYLTLDKTKLSVITADDFDKSAVENGLKLKSLSIERIPRTKYGSIRFLSAPSDDEYDQTVRSLKSRKDVISVLPGFLDRNNDSIGTTPFFYVKLKESTDYARLEQFAKEKQVIIVEQNEFMPLWYTLKCTQETAGDVLSLANVFYESGFFAAAEPDFLSYKRHCCNDPLFQDQWGLQQSTSTSVGIDACQAWGISQGSGIKVAVIDGGIELTHIDLIANIDPLSYDSDNNSSPSIISNSDNHGTACAGIIGATRNNNTQMAGVAPQCTLMSVSKYFRIRPDAADFRAIANGIHWAWRNGADVMNCSWSTAESSFIKEAVDSALIRGRGGKGCVMVFSSGNYVYNPLFPGNSRSDLIVVGSIDPNGKLSSFSNYAPLFAPGRDIYSTNLNNGTLLCREGTSYAAPHVAGVAALVLSRNPYLSAKEVQTILQKTAQKTGGYEYYSLPNRPNGTFSNELGYGVVDAYAAVQAAPSTTVFEAEMITSDTIVSGYNIEVSHVIVANNAKLTLDPLNEVIIRGDEFDIDEDIVFEVNLGSELEIK